MRLPLLLPLALLTTACGPEGSDRLASPERELYEATATVLESPGHGPELCLGGVAESYPPQCDGVPLVGWDWAAVEGEESVKGTTWGSFLVVGEYDGERIVVREARTAPDVPAATPADPVDTPCPEPPGGWQVVDHSRIDDAALHRAIELARSQPDHSGAWIDHLGEPTERHDGSVVVLTAAFTGDLARHEAQLRAVWGGPLCVVEHAHTLAELRAVQEELVAEVAAEVGLEVTSAAVDETRGVVQLGVVSVTDAQRDALVDRYGEGVVEVRPRLRLSH